MNVENALIPLAGFTGRRVRERGNPKGVQPYGDTFAVLINPQHVAAVGPASISRTVPGTLIGLANGKRHYVVEDMLTVRRRLQGVPEHLFDSLDAVLVDLLEYMEDREDADCVGDPPRYVANREMHLAEDIRNILVRLISNGFIKTS